MTIVHEIEPGRFVPFPSGHKVFRQAKTETVIVRREDGAETRQDRECEPYPVEVRPAEIALAWSREDREAAGLFEVVPFEIPEGKERMGAPRYRRDKGRVVEEYDLRDAAPPPTDAQKLENFAAEIGLTGDRLAELIAEKIAGRAARI